MNLGLPYFETSAFDPPTLLETLDELAMSNLVIQAFRRTSCTRKLSVHSLNSNSSKEKCLDELLEWPEKESSNQETLLGSAESLTDFEDSLEEQPVSVYSKDTLYPATSTVHLNDPGKDDVLKDSINDTGKDDVLKDSINDTGKDDVLKGSVNDIGDVEDTFNDRDRDRKDNTQKYVNQKLEHSRLASDETYTATQSDNQNRLQYYALDQQTYSSRSIQTTVASKHLPNVPSVDFDGQPTQVGKTKTLKKSRSMYTNIHEDSQHRISPAVEQAQQVQGKKKGFFSRLFSNKKQRPQSQPRIPMSTDLQFSTSGDVRGGFANGRFTANASDTRGFIGDSRMPDRPMDNRRLTNARPVVDFNAPKRHGRPKKTSFWSKLMNL